MTNTSAKKPVVVREATEGDREAVAAMLARAFADDGVSRWLDPDPDRAARAARAADVFAGLFDETARGMRLVTEDLAAATLWVAPEEDGRHHAEPDADMPHRARLMTEIFTAHRPRERHWYLHIAGCDPDRQGSGLGSAVVRGGLDRIRALPVYLETSKERNLGFYEGLGFRVTGEFDLPENGPHMWSMLRTAG